MFIFEDAFPIPGHIISPHLFHLVLCIHPIITRPQAFIPDLLWYPPLIIKVCNSQCFFEISSLNVDFTLVDDARMILLQLLQHLLGVVAVLYFVHRYLRVCKINGFPRLLLYSQWSQFPYYLYSTARPRTC